MAALAAIVDDAAATPKRPERLHKSQSALTYAVHKLESQLGVEGIHRCEGRKAGVTADRAICSTARAGAAR
jgi:hypothetical protein